MKEYMSENIISSQENEKEKFYKYDVMVVHGGGIRWNERREEWRTTNYSEGDDYGSLGSRIRVIAAQYLYRKKNFSENVITTTGKPIYLEEMEKKLGYDLSTESEIMKEELDKRSVPKEKIIAENLSKNTKQNLENLLEIVLSNGWKKILVVTSRYHVPRNQALLNTLIKKDNKYSGIIVDFVSAEDVLESDPERGSRWKHFIDKAYDLPEMKKRIANEEKGMRDLLFGGYNSIQEKK